MIQALFYYLAIDAILSLIVLAFMIHKKDLIIARIRYLLDVPSREEAYAIAKTASYEAVNGFDDTYEETEYNEEDNQ